MPKTKLFIGSAAAAKSQAKALVNALTSATLEFLPWWDAFTPGSVLLSELEQIPTQVDGAVLVFSPEAQATVRKNTVMVPNLNVMFEFGYFYGMLGHTKVVMVKYGDFYLPSDFGGYIHIFGSTFFERNKVCPVGTRTKTEFGKWLAAL